MIRRGEIHWADLGKTKGSRPAKRRPVLIVSADSYNESRLGTVLALVVTSNTDLAVLPGNVFIPGSVSGLARDSVANVTGVVTLNKTDLNGPVGQLPLTLLRDVDAGLRQVLGL